jgi:signal transduction histidine kinase
MKLDSSDKFRSARWKLTALYSLVALLVLVSFEVLFYIFYSQNVYNNFDAAIKNRALSISTSLENYDISSFEKLYLSDSEEKIFQESGELIQLIDKNGKVMLTVGDFKLADGKLTPDSFQTLYVSDTVNNQTVDVPIRCFVTSAQFQDSTIFLRVGRIYDNVSEALQSIIITMLIITPLILLLILLLAYRIAKFALKPVEKSYKMLKQFTEDSSHELKTPLSIIRTNLDIALSKSDGDADYLRNKMELVNKATNRMTDIVSRMSLLSKLDSGNFRIEKSTIDLYSFIEEKKEEFVEISKKKNIHIEFQGDKDIKATLDSFGLGEIMTNILNNAITYTGEGGNVSISLKNFGDHALISIADTGVGMSEEDLKHIFDRFYRSDRSRTRDTGGAGLGLSIVKEMVDLMGGSIDVKSEEGKGSTFSISLPLK